MPFYPHAMKNKRPGLLPTFPDPDFFQARPWPRSTSPRASTSVVARSRDKFLFSAEVVGRALARTAVLHDFVADLLSVCERAQASAFNCRNMDENVGAAVIRLDKTETLGGVEPLDCTCIHNDLLSKQPLKLPAIPCGLGSIIWKEI